MATTKFVNRARMLTSTTGTGTSVVLTTAVDGYFTLAEAGLQDGDVVDYIIEQGADFEIQHDQTYSSSGPSLSRGTPAASKVGGTAGTSKINLLGNAQVAIVGLAKSFDVSRFTLASSPTVGDLLWGHSDADGARRAIPIGGVLGLIPPSGLVLLDSGIISNQATLDVVWTSHSSFRGVMLRLNRIVPVNNDQALSARVSSNAGVTFDGAAGSYRYAGYMVADNFGDLVRYTSNSSDLIPIAGNKITSGEAVSNVAARGGVSAEIEFFGQADNSAYPHLQVRSVWVDTGGRVGTLEVVGIRSNAQKTDAVRIFFESGNIASGSWALYGLA